MTAPQDDPIDSRAANGLMLFPSPFGPTETMERMASAVTGLGMTVVARIDHAAAAAQVGLPLPPTLLLVFGNPAAGTPLMQAVPTVAIDLPLKALVWQDDEGRTWLACNDPARLVERHAASVAGSGFTEILARMRASLANAAAQATGAGDCYNVRAGTAVGKTSNSLKAIGEPAARLECIRSEFSL